MGAPYWFFRTALGVGGSIDVEGADTPRGNFAQSRATRPLLKSGVATTAVCAVAWHSWLDRSAPGRDAFVGATFDAMVHFVQGGSGTGVHLGAGLS